MDIDDAGDTELLTITIAKSEIIDKTITYLNELPLIQSHNLYGNEISGMAIMLCKHGTFQVDQSPSSDTQEVSFSSKINLDIDADEVIKMFRDRSRLERYGELHSNRKRILSDIDKCNIDEVIKKLRAVEDRQNALEKWDVQKYSKALDDINRSINLDPSYAEAYNTRASLYLKLNQIDHALEDCNQSIQIKPTYAKAYNNRGTVHAMLANNRQAVKDFEWAIHLNPEYSVAYINRGMQFTVSAKKDKAYENFRTACELGNSQGLIMAFKRDLIKPNAVINDIISRASYLQFKERNWNAALNLWEISNLLLNSSHLIIQLNSVICKYHLHRMKEIHREIIEMLSLLSDAPSPINDVLLPLALLSRYTEGNLESAKETALKIKQLYNHHMDFPGIPFFVGSDGSIVGASSSGEIVSALDAIKNDGVNTKQERDLLKALIKKYVLRERSMTTGGSSQKYN